MENLYTVRKNKTRIDCGSDHGLLIANFRLKLKKVRKASRPFRYDLDQIPYDYTVEMRNRFKELDLIDRVPDEIWTGVQNIVQETGIKTISKILGDEPRWQRNRTGRPLSLHNSSKEQLNAEQISQNNF